MEELLKSLAEEENDIRSVRIQIEDQVSTKMYDQHLPYLGRLTDDEIGHVMAFYRQMSYILDSHQTYNQAREADTPDNRDERKRQSREEWFSSYNISLSAENALSNLQDARNVKEDVNFFRYVVGS
ncbi:hypothetical protein ACFQAS_01720 [Halopenitus salinus]|uniref:Uncharacterized protein n=1 Tax=Halopenitus salinus TaxID=1198295 RepID=A0ABD5UTF9_9EURY